MGLLLGIESHEDLTARTVTWTTDALQPFDISISALAHQLGVSWHTAWDAIKAEATRRIAATGRLTGVDALGVDEHVWSHTGPGRPTPTGRWLIRQVWTTHRWDTRPKRRP